ncbi:L-rhamnose isomerase [Caldinitratiruptor microaerophilus]|uniref:L-rhamnose isomerase n=1 Tax=Caldinitratiruptor microaerophilus TaxID=671077 RepID=A0AA35CN51_9FIRM|nr:L-rhamnose isomerase [Caldinitratiruptor microaerophilus]BDG60416.1 L-rhamnose isomerase [Caldinitratiruptor microaerophilus]
MDPKLLEKEYAVWAEVQAARGVDVEAVKAALKAQRIETPSWGYGNSGTRFKVFRAPGAARTVEERIADAATVHRFTGVCPTVAIHIPWDRTDDYAALAAFAREQGVAIGAVNPNLFQDDEYRLGSVTHHDPAVRRKAVEHMLECVAIAGQVGSDLLSLWFADGTNYPGQGHIRRRRVWLEESLAEVYRAMPPGMRMLIEYKFFEPAWYHTDLPDWGTALTVAQALGPQAQVLVDTGHHPQGTNIPHIVALLLHEGRLGGFHFNDRKYADDDLIAGSVDPFQLFLIYNELVDAAHDPATAETARRVAFMVDQSHNIEPKIPAMIRTVMNIQAAYAKALLVDRQALARAQAEGDVLGAAGVLRDAFETDVRPLLARVRQEMGLDPDPLAAYLRSGIQQRLEAERAGPGTGWGG